MTPILDLVVDRHAETLDEDATATFSPDRTYRYALTRRWDTSRPMTAWVMLNPSTADAFVVDPTVRRCVAFARSWGAGGVLVLNLFALRSTDPQALLSHPDPVGPVNDLVIAHHFSIAHEHVGPVFAAWGAHRVAAGRAELVTQLLKARCVRMLALGVTRHGHPRHPLYLPASATAVDYPLADGAVTGATPVEVAQ
jgi:hypothetical protein